MNRRKFLAAALGTPLASFPLRGLAAESAATRQKPVACGWRVFDITTRVTLPEVAGPAQLWLPLAQTVGDYQVVLDLGYSDPTHMGCVYDARYGAPVLHARWDASDSAPRHVTTKQIVMVRDRTGASSFLPLTEAERKFWTAPTESLPLDGVVLATAARITAGKTGQREKLRAIYDWVVDHTYRDPDVPGCGRGDLKAMLAGDRSGGKCADINGLLVGLARAAGFPARDVYGIRVTDSRLFPSLGAQGDVAKAQHCRAEVFLDGEGWFPLDPADVAKVILTEKLALDSPEVRTLRDHQFGNWEMNWIGYNSATDIELPGDDGKQKPDFTFLMYPCAVTSAGRSPCAEPGLFHYEIIAHELPAVL